LKQHLWKDDASCLDLNTNFYFEEYEDNIDLRSGIDNICMSCPVRKVCFANGVSGKEWGIWGGVYLEGGEISKEFNRHKSKQDWSNIWQSLTME
jgi:hypothetical protein